MTSQTFHKYLTDKLTSELKKKFHLREAKVAIFVKERRNGGLKLINNLCNMISTECIDLLQSNSILWKIVFFYCPPTSKKKQFQSYFLLFWFRGTKPTLRLLTSKGRVSL